MGRMTGTITSPISWEANRRRRAACMLVVLRRVIPIAGCHPEPSGEGSSSSRFRSIGMLRILRLTPQDDDVLGMTSETGRTRLDSSRAPANLGARGRLG